MTTYYKTLEEARRDPGSYLVLEQDDVGYLAYVGCPIKMVGASEANLRQLWLDCSNVDSGTGFDPSSKETDNSDEIRISYVNYHASEEDQAQQLLRPFGLDRDLEDLMLRDQIESVLRGNKARLELPPRFPHDDPESIQQVIGFPKARMLIRCHNPGITLVDASVGIVNVTDDVLQQFSADLDAHWQSIRLESTAQLPRSTICFIRNHHLKNCDHRKPIPDLILHPHRLVGITESAVREVLAGTRPRL